MIPPRLCLICMPGTVLHTELEHSRISSGISTLAHHAPYGRGFTHVMVDMRTTLMVLQHT